MLPKDQVLTPSAARAYYDRFGKKQDSQGLYEDPALAELISHSDFQDARQVFEFGCGTGKLAHHLLSRHLPTDAHYLGCDISPVMLDLTRQRLIPYRHRAQAVQVDGVVRFPLGAQSVDRIICCYVLDLLSSADIRHFFTEAQRVLKQGGLICLASLCQGRNYRSRMLAAIWTALFRLNPAIVGGCRPIQLQAFIDRYPWQILHQAVVTPFGIASEVLVVQKTISLGQ